MVQAVGIDLGTTFSAIALVGQDGQARPVLNAEGAPTTPSVAIWHNGAFLVGQPARELVHRTVGAERERLAAALIGGVKRMMGHAPVGGLSSNGYRTHPVEVSAAILAKLARDASARLGFSVRDAVVTVPAHFGDRERKSTKDAAEIAGLRVLQMINEPSAAALTYTHGKQAVPGSALVFDLGGGTFDATIIQLGEKVPHVLGTEGIEELGGINFTNSLASRLEGRYRAETKTPYPTDSISNDMLFAVAEGAKCQLSDVQTTRVSLTPSQGMTVELEVTRTQFERLLELHLIHLQTAVELALRRAGKTPAEITRVLLCGGSSRIPAVQNMLTTLFGRPPEQVVDLDLGVALGAAYLAAYCEQMQQPTPGPGLQLIEDCVSYPVGIAVWDTRGEQLVKMVMLRPGDPLDTWSMPYAVRIAGTMTDFPPIKVYKGEGLPPYDNDYLGDITLTLPPGTPPGARATIMMRQDQSGLMQVQLTLNDRALPGSLRRPQETLQPS